MIASPGKCPNCGNNAPLMPDNNKCFRCGVVGIPTKLTNKQIAANLKSNAAGMKSSSLETALRKAAEIYENTND